MILIGRVCYLCQGYSVLSVDADNFAAWETGDLLVQDAFPELSDNERELILTGTHGECFDKYFSEEDANE